MTSSARMRNSELAKKLKARAANKEEEKTSLLSGVSSSSEQSNDGYGRFAFLAPFMACQSPDISFASDDGGKDGGFVGRKEIASPSSMNYCPARNHLERREYPLLYSETRGGGIDDLKGRSPKREKAAVKATAVATGTEVNTGVAHKNKVAGEEVKHCKSAMSRSPTRQDKIAKQVQAAAESSNKIRPLDKPKESKQPESSLASTPTRKHTNSSPRTPTTSSPGNTCDSSLFTCAPSSVIMVASTSAHSPSVTAPRGTSSPKNKESKNLLRLIYDMDDDKKKKNRVRASTADEGKLGKSKVHVDLPWKLSPFSKKGRKTTEIETNQEAKSPTATSPSRQIRIKGTPIDIDEVSLNSNDSSAGYYSDPTNADIRNGMEIHTNPSHDTGRTDLPLSRKCLDSERVLSQLGMDVHEDDYCIEGEYYDMMRRNRHNNVSRGGHGGGHRRVGSGRWNYHQRKPSNVDSDRLNVGEVIVTTHNSRRRSKLGENIKESMKKIGNIIKDEDLDIDKCGRVKSQHPNETKLGSKVLSMFRGHSSKSSIPQQITITPSMSSEDPEGNMTPEEFELMHRWQMARARCRNEVSKAAVTPSASLRVGKTTHRRDGSEAISIAVSDGTAHVDNRRQVWLDGTGRGSDCSF